MVLIYVLRLFMCVCVFFAAFLSPVSLSLTLFLFNSIVSALAGNQSISVRIDEVVPSLNVIYLKLLWLKPTGSNCHISILPSAHKITSHIANKQKPHDYYIMHFVKASNLFILSFYLQILLRCYDDVTNSDILIQTCVRIGHASIDLMDIKTVPKQMTLSNWFCFCFFSDNAKFTFDLPFVRFFRHIFQIIVFRFFAFLLMLAAYTQNNEFKLEFIFFSKIQRDILIIVFEKFDVLLLNMS